MCRVGMYGCFLGSGQQDLSVERCSGDAAKKKKVKEKKPKVPVIPVHLHNHDNDKPSPGFRITLILSVHV